MINVAILGYGTVGSGVFEVLNENKEMYTDISYKDREYTIVYNVIKNENGKSAKYLMMLYWIDKTDFLQMQKKYNEEKNAIMLIQVDGYDEVLKSADEENRPLFMSPFQSTHATLSPAGASVGHVT